jgi:hypothetical protein
VKKSTQIRRAIPNTTGATIRKSGNKKFVLVEDVEFVVVRRPGLGGIVVVAELNHRGE